MSKGVKEHDSNAAPTIDCNLFFLLFNSGFLDPEGCREWLLVSKDARREAGQLYKKRVLRRLIVQSMRKMEREGELKSLVDSIPKHQFLPFFMVILEVSLGAAWSASHFSYGFALSEDNKRLFIRFCDDNLDDDEDRGNVVTTLTRGVKEDTASLVKIIKGNPAADGWFANLLPKEFCQIVRLFICKRNDSPYIERLLAGVIRRNESLKSLIDSEGEIQQGGPQSAERQQIDLQGGVAKLTQSFVMPTVWIIFILLVVAKFFSKIMQEYTRGVPLARDTIVSLSIIMLLVSAAAYYPVCRLKKDLAARGRVINLQKLFAVLEISENGGDIDDESLLNVSEGVGWKSESLK